MITRMSTVLTGPRGTESEWIRVRREKTVQVFPGKFLDVRRQGGETERVNARVADSHSGGFTPEFAKPRLVGFVPVLPVGPVVVDRGQEVLNLLECSLELSLAGGLDEDVEGSVGPIVRAHAS